MLVRLSLSYSRTHSLSLSQTHPFTHALFPLAERHHDMQCEKKELSYMKRALSTAKEPYFQAPWYAACSVSLARTVCYIVLHFCTLCCSVLLCVPVCCSAASSLSRTLSLPRLPLFILASLSITRTFSRIPTLFWLLTISISFYFSYTQHIYQRSMYCSKELRRECVTETQIKERVPGYNVKWCV